MIEIRNLSKEYKADNKTIVALKNINLTIGKGEIYGVIGLSGAGKSSLLRCINLLEKPTSGCVLVDDVDITSLRGKSLRNTRKKTGMIFQHFNLLMNSTVYENIAFPLRLSGVPSSEIAERVNELLVLVELGDKKHAYPSQLSGGQKQRVGIARALANNPEIILCDEATSALDPTTTQSILNLLKDINRRFNITIIVITHEMSVIKNLCDRVAVIEDGVILEQGSVIDVFSDPKTETSKRFLRDMDVSLPSGSDFTSNSPLEKVLKIHFLGEVAKEPVVSNIIKRFNVEANIIAGKIEEIQNTQIGSLIIKLSGSSSDINLALNYLAEKNLRIEVISDVKS